MSKSFKILQYLIREDILLEEIFIPSYGLVKSMDQFLYQTEKLHKTPLALYRHIDELYFLYGQDIFSVTEKLLMEIRNPNSVCKYIFLWAHRKKIDIPHFEK